MHAVPVPWIEYIPVQRTSQIAVGLSESAKAAKTEENRRRFAADTLFHGLAAWILEEK